MNDGPDFGVCLTHGSPLNGFIAPGRERIQLGTLALWSTGGRETAGLRTVSFSTCPTDPTQDAIDYNRVVQRRGKKKVEDMLKTVEPRHDGRFVPAIRERPPGISLRGRVFPLRFREVWAAKLFFQGKGARLDGVAPGLRVLRRQGCGEGILALGQSGV